jgi:hypothetical protein
VAGRSYPSAYAYTSPNGFSTFNITGNMCVYIAAIIETTLINLGNL